MNDKVEGQGKAVILPSGVRRIDYIRDNYYNSETGLHGEGEMSRSEIRNSINEQLEEAGLTDQQIPYQIVFAATKTPEDPRIAAAAAAKVRAENKAAKDAAKAAEKEAADKAKDKKGK